MGERIRTIPALPLLDNMKDSTPMGEITATVRLLIVRDDSSAGIFEKEKLGGGSRDIRVIQTDGTSKGVLSLLTNEYLCIEVDGKLVPIAKGGCIETSFPQPIDPEAHSQFKLRRARKKLGLDK